MSSHCAERARAALLVAVACSALAACDREKRRFHDSLPEASASAESTALSGHDGVTPRPGPYGENAYALNDGKRLFFAFNCAGCHEHGGGGMGPALMDSAWIYGFEPANIYATIANGRPNGMPAFRDRITPEQIWELAAYVRSMSGQGSKAARPNRSDEMEVRTSEAQTTTQKPVIVKPPPPVVPSPGAHP
jgi:cytochrome c oxidase cbb3-type subunit III